MSVVRNTLFFLAAQLIELFSHGFRFIAAGLTFDMGHYQLANASVAVALQAEAHHSGLLLDHVVIAARLHFLNSELLSTNHFLAEIKQYSPPP
jgi:hypothetical protein